jgi:hypothetical protein
MRARRVLAGAALIVALALLALPTLAASTTRGPSWSPQSAGFRAVRLDPRLTGVSEPIGGLDTGLRSSGAVDDGSTFSEPAPGAPPPPSRAAVGQPGARGGFSWKPPRYSLTGTATFYDNGTTAMLLPAGTIIRVCGPGGCLERVVNDRGPFGEGRIIDLQRADFFEICGCPSWSGTATVTVHVY